MTTPTTSRVSDEMVEAAIKAHDEECIRGSQDDTWKAGELIHSSMRAALEAALVSLGDVVAVSAVLDEPAKVGAVTFGVGVSWSSVIACAQRAYKHKDDPSPTPEQIADLSSILNRGGK